MGFFFPVRLRVERAAALQPVGRDGENLSWRNIAIWGVIKHKIMDISMWKCSFVSPSLLCWAMRQTAILAAQCVETTLVFFSAPMISVSNKQQKKKKAQRWNLEQILNRISLNSKCWSFRFSALDLSVECYSFALAIIALPLTLKKHQLVQTDIFQVFRYLWTCRIIHLWTKLAGVSRKEPLASLSMHEIQKFPWSTGLPWG